MANQEVDPWLDTEFGRVDFNTYREDRELEPDTETTMIQPDFGQVAGPAELVTNVSEPEPAPVQTVEIEPEGPEVIDLGDGSRIEIEKSSKGWKASLQTGTGGAENFYGKTKNELIQNIAVGKLNATKKIRELNKQVKLGSGKETPAPAQRTPTPAFREPTADEVFAIKAKLDSNPVLAMDEMFQLRTGMSMQQLVALAQKGQQASQELSAEAVSKAFLAGHPGYYADEHYENFTSLIAYIAKNRIGRILTQGNKNELYDQLVAEGHYTVQNLDEAFEELNEAGLLVSPPRRPEVTPAPQQATPAPPPADPRIVSRVVQPRAGLGLRQTEATPVRAEAPKPPSVDDLDSLSDEQIKELLNQSLRLKRTQGRSSKVQ